MFSFKVVYSVQRVENIVRIAVTGMEFKKCHLLYNYKLFKRSYFTASATRIDLGLPDNWERTVKWLRNKIVISEPSNTHVLFVKAKANPEIPTLDSYSGSAPDSFWEKFPKTGLPSQIQTKINTEVLDEKIEAVKGKMLPHQFARAKKAVRLCAVI